MSLASRRKGEGTEDFGKTWDIYIYILCIYILYVYIYIYIIYIMGILYIYIWECPFNANNYIGTWMLEFSTIPL